MTAEQIANQQRYAPKTLAAIQMVDAGISPREALQITNVKENISREAVTKFKAKHRKYSLTHPRMVKLAHNAVKDCLTDQPILSKRTDKQGNEIIEENVPTWANKIAAATMVYDRAEPTRGNPEVVNNNLTINAIPAAAQEIIDRMMANRSVKVEGSVIDVLPEGPSDAK